MKESSLSGSLYVNCALSSTSFLIELFLTRVPVLGVGDLYMRVFKSALSFFQATSISKSGSLNANLESIASFNISVLSSSNGVRVLDKFFLPGSTNIPLASSSFVNRTRATLSAYESCVSSFSFPSLSIAVKLISL